jgi:hypothetical protein
VKLTKYAATAIVLLSLTNIAFCADERFPIAGSYGFDWLKPQSTRCVQITSEHERRFKKCRLSKEHAFGLDLYAYSCKINPHSEYIVLKTKEQCQQTFETMEANAP